MTCDVTPHHLALTDEWVAGRARSLGRWDASGDPWRTGRSSAAPYDASLRVNPPLRSPADAAACLAALADGTADAIATDHAPHTEVDKAVEFGLAANGISGIETALGLVLAAVDAGRLPLRARDRGADDRAGRVLGARTRRSAASGSSRARRRTSSSSIASESLDGDAGRARVAGQELAAARAGAAGPRAPDDGRRPGRLRGRRATDAHAERRAPAHGLGVRYAPRRWLARARSTTTTSAGRTGRRRCRPCPTDRAATCRTRTDVVVIGGGYAGINAARELARRGRQGHAARGARRSGSGRSTRNGGIVHAGYKWSARELIKRYGEDTGRALYQETLDAYQTGQAADRRARRSTASSARSATSSSRMPRATSPELEHARDSLALRSASESTLVPRERIREEIGTDAYYGGLRRRRQRAAPSRASTSPAWPRPPTRAGADLHEGVRARTIRRQADGRFVVETTRGAILARDVLVATNGYTDGVAARRSAAGSSRSAATSSRPSRSPRTWPASSRRRAGRSSTRRTSCTTGTSRPTAG